MLPADRRWIERKEATRLLPSGIACSLLLLLAPTLEAQVPVLVAREPGTAEQPSVRERPAPVLSWEEKRNALIKAGIPAPPRPPSQFVLTPRAPHRLPGGYLAWYGPGRYGRWNSGYPATTGYLVLTSDRDSYLAIHIEQVKPNTQYLLDMSLSGSPRATFTVRGRCGPARGPLIGSFPGKSGPHHVFLVMPTDAFGNACFSLETDANAAFHKVEITELGPAP